MYEEDIVRLLSVEENPLSIMEIREILSQKRNGRVSYETVKRDLIGLAAKGIINSKATGKSKRTSWVFWLPRERVLKAFETLRLKDPFDISIRERDSMSPKQLSAVYDQLIERYADLIKQNIGKDARFLILCDRRVVASRSSEFSDGEIKRLELEHGKVCYIITEDLVEESPWSPLNGDFYPTINISLGPKDWRDEKVFKEGLQVIADFDTGNPDISAFNCEKLSLTMPEGRRFMRRAIHLGKSYDYYLFEVKIGIHDALNKVRCIGKTCRGVLSWGRADRNPFLLANPNRDGFVGRDIMINFPFEILLSGKSKDSKIYLA